MLGAASVIVDEQGRVLLVKHAYGELNWELPGGGGESGESAEETARREAREEVGIQLDVERISGVYWESAKDAHHFVFRARHRGEPHVASPEITDLGWFSPDRLPRPISDFTLARIADALATAPARVTSIGPRKWLR
jgi:8-oxo-dGTP pyrophosphatase MutT (NUDIX family)